VTEKIVLTNDERRVLEALSTRPGHFAVPRTERELRVQTAVMNALKLRGFVRCVDGERWQITDEGGRWLASNPKIGERGND
jgi:hypothetical protein